MRHLIAGSSQNCQAEIRQWRVLASLSLAPRIPEPDAIVREDDRLIEAHPEVYFAALAGEPLAFSKMIWNGHALRVQLLANEGIRLPVDLGKAGLAGTCS